MDNRPPVDSHTLFPQMMQSTRLLVIDYDVFRYTSFDLFRYLLTDRQLFGTCDPMMRRLVLHQTFPHQVYRYERGCPYFNPYEAFSDHSGMKLLEYEQALTNHFPSLKTTPTELCDRFGVVFDRHTITGYILRYSRDRFELPFDTMVKTYRGNSILDLRMACAIIQKHQINAVMLSSVDLAILLAAKLQDGGITTPITFIIGSYQYNMDYNGMLRLVPEMVAYEQKYKHEFGMYEPFTNLAGIFKNLTMDTGEENLNE